MNVMTFGVKWNRNERRGRQWKMENGKKPIQSPNKDTVTTSTVVCV